MAIEPDASGNPKASPEKISKREKRRLATAIVAHLDELFCVEGHEDEFDGFETAEDCSDDESSAMSGHDATAEPAQVLSAGLLALNADQGFETDLDNRETHKLLQQEPSEFGRSAQTLKRAVAEAFPNEAFPASPRSAICLSLIHI